MTERKSGSSTVVGEEVRAALGRVQGLSGQEERVLRLLHGAWPDPQAPLGRVVPADSELGDELLVLELQLLRAVRARAAHAAAGAGTTDPARKSKIVRALRKKR